MATKHDQILKHIEELPIGDRISVRSIAKSLSVSEGTAFFFQAEDGIRDYRW